MRIAGLPRRTIWPSDEGTVEIIDQTLLPHEVAVRTLCSGADAAHAIATMQVRGAPLIGVTAAFGLALALRQDASDPALDRARAQLGAARPTAVNLAWALDRVAAAVRRLAANERAAAAWREALVMAEEDVAACRAIGAHGAALIEEVAQAKGDAGVEILTHCNAGWLATVDYGTALAPIYLAAQQGVRLHVWVDETRPRNQGAALTAFELGQEGIDHTVIVDNAGGHLMQQGKVDLVLVGADRITRTGDAANKIGTYLKALAARDTGVPFHVAAPSSTIDFSLTDGVRQIPIEQRDGAEVMEVTGALTGGGRATVTVVAPGSRAANYAFDVTPARLITGLITERGRCAATEAAISGLFFLNAGKPYWQARHSS